MEQVSAVDLFCGAGGLTHGFELEGIKVNAGIDIDLDAKYPYEYNNEARFVHKDVRELEGSELRGCYPPEDVKILAGCAPCQPFSTYTQRYDKSEDSEVDLLCAFACLVEEVRPEIIAMENVCRIKKHMVYAEFVRALKHLNYQLDSKEVECLRFGVPQSRKRLVLLASSYGPIKLIPYTHSSKRYRTVRNKIGRMEKLEAGEASKRDRLHRASGLSPLNLDRIRASRPGKSWREWKSDLVAACHTKDTGDTYPSVYGRMKWDEPASTLTTQFFGFGNGRFGHPEQDRAISLREGALLQTFPRYYKFVAPREPIHFKQVGRWIGNAVPVRLGRVVARSIVKHLEEHNGGFSIQHHSEP